MTKPELNEQTKREIREVRREFEVIKKEAEDPVEGARRAYLALVELRRQGKI